MGKLSTALALSLLAVHLGYATAWADFAYSDFSSTTGLNSRGNAAQSGNFLCMAPPLAGQCGYAWYGTKQNVATGFTTDFQFRITPSTVTPADGFWFILRNDTPPATGEQWPYPDKSVVVEFDIYKNPPATEKGDPDSNHMGLFLPNNDGDPHNHSHCIGCATANQDMKDGNLHNVRIRYTPGTLNVFLDNMSTPNLTVPFTLSATNFADGKGYVGISAETGGLWADHDLYSWSFTAAPEPATMSFLMLAAMAILRKRRTR